MYKNVLIGLVAFTLILGGVWWFWPHQKISTGLNNPLAKKEVTPSETSIEYIDPAGFSFLYPDNLSITNNLTSETPDPEAYADLQLFSKDVSGSLTLTIVDSSYKSVDEWRKENSIPESNKSVEKKLGEMSAFEIKTADRVTLIAIDQGILFTVESPLIEQAFWMPVYEELITNFAFSASETVATSGSINSDSEVIFEGEEVIE